MSNYVATIGKVKKYLDARIGTLKQYILKKETSNTNIQNNKILDKLYAQEGREIEAFYRLKDYIDCLDINTKNELLFKACLANCKQICCLLLKNGANPNMRLRSSSNEIVTLLDIVISINLFDHKDILRILLAANADPFIIIGNKLEVIIRVVQLGQLEDLEEIISFCSGVNYISPKENNFGLLYWAILKKRDKIIEFLMDNDCIIDDESMNIIKESKLSKKMHQLILYKYNAQKS